VRGAREFVTATLREWGLSPLQEDMVLLTSELVTNAILHGRCVVRVAVQRLDARGVVRVEVQDGGRDVPLRTSPRRLATTGRGLNIVIAAAQSFGVAPAPRGKTVWFELATPAPLLQQADAAGDDQHRQHQG
jgi:anti-sigma regulatory factor (Ser/Thr protein kinase)